MRKILMLALFLTAAAAATQTVELAHWAQGVAPLDQGWKTHAGDNSAGAAPGFDDYARQSATLPTVCVAFSGMVEAYGQSVPVTASAKMPGCTH